MQVLLLLWGMQRNILIHLIFHILSYSSWLNIFNIAYKCIRTEAEHAGMVYVLNNGKWYEVVRDFAALVKRDFATLPESTLVLPAYTTSYIRVGRAHPLIGAGPV